LIHWAIEPLKPSKHLDLEMRRALPSKDTVRPEVMAKFRKSADKNRKLH